MDKNTMTTMTIRISSDLKQSLENAAALNDESVSHAIRSCIDSYITNSCHSKDGSMHDIPEENLQRITEESVKKESGEKVIDSIFSLLESE